MLARCLCGKNCFIIFLKKKNRKKKGLEITSSSPSSHFGDRLFKNLCSGVMHTLCPKARSYTSVCLTSTLKQRPPSHSQGLSGVLVASWQPDMALVAWAQPCIASSATGRGLGRKLEGFVVPSEPGDNQHPSQTVCPRECISAPSEHTQSTQQG